MRALERREWESSSGMKKNLFPARRVFGWPVTWAATNQTRDLGFQLMIRWLIVVDDTDQRMRKMKARARQIIPVTFSSLQQRLQKEFVNNLGLGGKGGWWWSGWMPTIYFNTLGKYANFSVFEFALVKLAPCKIEMGSQTCNNTSTIEKQPGKEESPGKNQIKNLNNQPSLKSQTLKTLRMD